MEERLEKVAGAIKEIGADWVVLTTFGAVCYATGHVVPIEAGPSPFAGGPTIAAIRADGLSVLIHANVEQSSANESWADEKLSYTGFDYRQPEDVGNNFHGAVRDAASRFEIGGVIAAERGFFPTTVAEILGIVSSPDITPVLKRARAVKTQTERQQLKMAASAAAVGQEKFYSIVQPGLSELAAFGAIRTSMEVFAGERVAVTGDFVSGRERTAVGGGWPVKRTLQVGDPVICDLAPRVGGYWGDSCASAIIGGPSSSYLNMFNAARTALEQAIGMMRPGLIVSELDAALRRTVRDAGYEYPHHSGHSIGTDVHEWPRLIPGEAAALREGMFLMVEPGAYDPEVGGVRTEYMVEITASGCQVVAPFPLTPRFD